MQLRRLSRCALLALALSPLFAHAADIKVQQSWARPTVAKQPTGAAYLTIENSGKSADVLVKASSPAAREVQIHSMKMEGDVMRMREVPKLEVPAGGNVAMKPGDGYHLMLIGLKQPLKAGDKLNLTLVFEKAGQVEVTVPVENKAGAAAHPMQDHKH